MCKYMVLTLHIQRYVHHNDNTNNKKVAASMVLMTIAVVNVEEEGRRVRRQKGERWREGGQ